MKVGAVKAPRFGEAKYAKQLRRSVWTSQSRSFRSTVSTRFSLACRCARSSARPRIWLANVRIKPMARAGNAMRPGLCLLSSVKKDWSRRRSRCFELFEWMLVTPRSRRLARRAAGRSSGDERMLTRPDPQIRYPLAARPLQSRARSCAAARARPARACGSRAGVNPTRRPRSRCGRATLGSIRS
jgi:hypothetical protein